MKNMYFKHLFRKSFMWLFLLTAFSFAGNLSYGQTTVTIGSGTTAGYLIPVNGFYGYSYTQQIVLQEEIAVNGDITKIRFYMVTNVDLASSNDWTIYIGHTTKSSFASTTDWEPLANLTQVYTGTIATNPAEGWYEITFTTPFPYNNTSNLIVAVDENSAGYSSSSNYARTWTTPVANRAIHYRSDTQNPDPASPPSATGRLAYINQMQFEILQPPCTGTPDPGNTIASANPVCVGNDFTLSLQNFTSGSGITYQWQSSPDNALWTDIGTSDANLTTSIGEKTFFQCVVTCTNSGESATSTPVEVDINIAPLTYTEEFNTTDVPACWTTTGWEIGSANGVTGNPGNNIYTSLSASNETATFTTGGIGPIIADTYLSFDYIVANSNTPYGPPPIGTGNFVVSISTDGGNTYTDLEQVNNNLTAGWQLKSYNLSSYSGEIVKFKFVATRFSGDYDLAFDNLTVGLIPTCQKPKNLIADNITATSANLAWTEMGSATEWNLKVSSSVIDPNHDAAEIEMVMTTNPFELTEGTLTQNTTITGMFKLIVAEETSPTGHHNMNLLPSVVLQEYLILKILNLLLCPNYQIVLL
ncbi:MAG: hypothetical protein PHW82_15115 [Bacteroidales bacterium]|nr:hypothetical protein [Bacteroidales bacterium]